MRPQRPDSFFSQITNGGISVEASGANDGQIAQDLDFGTGVASFICGSTI
jgi:hypothetical protein